MVEITKAESGNVEVSAVQDGTKNTLPLMVTDESKFLELLSEDEMGNVGLEQILQIFVKSLRVVDTETMELGVVKVDKQAEAEEIARWKQEALDVQKKRDEDDDRTRQEKARKRAQREKDRLENQALAREHLLQRVEYARKIMQIEVERMKKLKLAREKAQKEIEMAKPELTLPVGLLLRVRRVINGEMATLEITKKGSDSIDSEQGAVEFKTTGDSGDVYSLLTSEKELVDLLDEKHLREEPTPSDLLRTFSKMIVFDQDENSRGLRLHAVDEDAENERMRQWREQASLIEKNAEHFVDESRPGSKASSISDNQLNVSPAVFGQDNNGKENSILLVDSLIAGERLPDGIEFEMNFEEGSRRKTYIVNIKLSGHKLTFTATLKSSVNRSTDKALHYSCSLDHALMLLPTEKQLWDTEKALFKSLRPCIRIIDGGRSLALRRNVRGTHAARDRGFSIAQKIAEETGLDFPESTKTLKQGHGKRHRSNEIGVSWGGFGSRQQAREAENQELMRLIKEQYLRASVDDEDDWISEVSGSKKRKKKRGRRRGRSVKKMNGGTPEDIARRLASIDGTHKELLPASRGPSRGASRGRPGRGSLDSAIIRDMPSPRRMDRRKVFGGFGKCSSRLLLRRKHPYLDSIQSSILSKQGSVAARERLKLRLSQSYLGPDIDPLLPLEARPKGKLFVKKTLRDFLNGGTEIVSGYSPAELPPGLSLRGNDVPSSLQAVESRLLISDSGRRAFQIVAQKNRWGSPERRRGPGFRTLACKWERKKKSEKAKRLALARANWEYQHKILHDRGLE